MTFFNIFSKGKKEKETKVIIADNREKNSLVCAEIIGKGYDLRFQQLPVADYLVNDVAIERKTTLDFQSSIIDKRMIKQIMELKQYKKHLLIIEGISDSSIYKGPIHENAVRGFLLSIALNYQVPLIYTQNEKDTANFISVLANKSDKNTASFRASKITLSDKEQLEFILEGVPSIGPITAKKLLSHFKTLKDIVNASQEELEKVIGKKAEAIYKLLNMTY